jgi:hypothetical protein
MRFVALLRGVNVGRGNRVAMADLRAAVATCGYTDVGTVLASGSNTLASVVNSGAFTVSSGDTRVTGTFTQTAGTTRALYVAHNYGYQRNDTRAESTDYAGTAYSLQAQYDSVDFGDPIVLTCDT